jgi:hypothetical protein
MNCVENLKSTQWRKLFKLFNSSGMQSLNIFGVTECFLFEFTSLSGVWKFEKLFSGSGPHVSHRSSPPTWVGPSLALLRTSPRKPMPTLLYPFSRSVALLAALLQTGHCFARRCLSPMSHPELSNRAKRSASSPRPSCTKSLPAAPASEAGPQDFPVVVFFHERLAGGSPLRLFPHPHRPRSKLRAAKELLPDHFLGHLDHSLGLSLASPRHRRACRRRYGPSRDHPLPDLPS